MSYKEAYEICRDFIQECIDQGTICQGYAEDILFDAKYETELEGEE